MRRVRLRYRLPNPPPVFVGREEESVLLSDFLQRGPVVVITGPGGVGKTALSLRTLHLNFPERVSRVIFLGLRPGVPTDQVRMDMLRAMLASGADFDLDAEELKGDPEALTEAAIDMAEENGFWFVLDDVHHAVPNDELRELLILLSSYARESRFLATSRRELGPDLKRRTLVLGPLSPENLTSLAHSIAPEKQDIHRAVAASSGSPWLLQQYLATGEAGVALTRETLTEKLGTKARELLSVLSLLQAPLPTSILSELTPLPDDEMLDLMENRGLLQRGDGGFRLHDVVSSLFDQSAAGADRKKEIAELLAERSEPEAWIEAMRLWMELGSSSALATFLDARAESLLERGYAASLWSQIVHKNEPALAKWQLRCAAELGNPTALAQVSEPEEPAAADRLAWAETLYAKGDVESAEEHAQQIDSEDAVFLRGRCAIHRGQTERARSILTELDASFRRDALTANASAREGAAKDLSALLPAAQNEAPEAVVDLSEALYFANRKTEALVLLNQVLQTPRGGRAATLVARRAMLLSARIHLESGSLRQTAHLLETVQPFARTTSLLLPVVLELRASYRLMVGDLDQFDATLSDAQRESAAIDEHCGDRVAAIAQRWALLRALPVGDVKSVDTGRLTEALRILRAVRLGTDVQIAQGTTREAKIVVLLSKTCRAMFAEDYAAAQRYLTEAQRFTDGNQPWHAEVLLGFCELALLVGKGELEAGERLHQLAEKMGSPRLVHEADLVCSNGEPSVLERIAADAHETTPACRRARALLGGVCRLDNIDRLLVARFSERRGGTMLCRSPASDWGPGWGLDGRKKAVWLSDGREIDLSNRPLFWRILTLLAAHPAGLSKEQVVLSAWNEREYHPARHDSKLHVAIRKLRQAIEREPSEPTLLVTTEEGYRLAGVVRRLEP